MDHGPVIRDHRTMHMLRQRKEAHLLISHLDLLHSALCPLHSAFCILHLALQIAMHRTLLPILREMAQPFQLVRSPRFPRSGDW